MILPQLHMVQGVLQGHTNQLIPGAVGSGREVVVTLLKGSVDADGHGNGLIFAGCNDKFFPNASLLTLLSTL